MGERIRAFVAIELDESCRTSLGAYAQTLREKGVKASWVNVANLHITLRFLGEVEQSSLDTLVECIMPRYAQLSAFAISFAGPGVFPLRGRPRVLWVGIDDVAEALTKCHEIATEGAREVAANDDSDNFFPHVTLARFREPIARRRLETALNRAGETSAGEMSVSHVSLFASELNPGGSAYRVLRRFPLEESPA